MTLDPTLPDWVFPPPGGFVADDLDRIPDLPPHTELIDGSLVFVSPRAFYHFITVYALYTALGGLAPPDLLVVAGMTVKLGARHRPGPDVMILKAGAFTDAEQTGFQAADVLLAVEVVSPESETRDRERKPQLYAEAGIKHFWRVEKECDQIAVHVHELDEAAGKYALSGVHRRWLELEAPFPIDIDLTAIERSMRGPVGPTPRPPAAGRPPHLG